MSEERFGHTLELPNDKRKKAKGLCDLAEAMLNNCLTKIEQLGVTVKAVGGNRINKRGPGVVTNAIVLTPEKLFYYHPEKD